MRSAKSKNTSNVLKYMAYACFVFILMLHGSLDLVVLKSVEYRYKKEVKKLIKSGIDEKDLLVLVFNANIFNKPEPGFEWHEKDEFRYNNNMYDIVKFRVENDSVYFYCFHDSKETDLFVNMDKKIAEYLAATPGGKVEIKTVLISFNKFFQENSFNSTYSQLFIQEVIYNSTPEATLSGYYPNLIPPPKV